MKTLLKTYFGYDKFRPLQEEIINNVLDKKDSFVLMPTGGGKSLCFQLPALKLSGLTLVISPLISLMKDQIDSLRENGIPAEYLNSTQTPEQQNEIKEKLQENQIKILYIAPERLALLSFQTFLKTLNISLIAIDEAHCISEWGHDFRPNYRNLAMLKNIFSNTPVIALTATATKKVREDIVRQLVLSHAKTFISSFNRENLNLSIINKKNAFIKLVNLLDSYKNKSVIIYCFSRKETEEIAEKLNDLDLKALPYHAGLAPAIRKKHQEMFINDNANIIVATIAFGMGIDKPDVRLVVHYTYPKTLESYYQEIGRAGRDGLPSECVMFYTYADTRRHEFFINQIRDAQIREIAQEKLNEVLQYAELDTCRKKYLLKYFGEDLKKNNCKSCDICLTKTEKIDATVITQKILSAILRANSMFGKNHIIDILLGKNTQQIRRHGHDNLSVFGIVDDFSQDELTQIIRSLLNLSFIQKNTGQYPTLAVSKKGTKFLQNNEKLELNKPKKDVIRGKKTKIELDYDHALFEILRVLRKQLSEQKNVPPFAIFGDKSLHEMACYFPIEHNSFANINGVGEQKLKKYADIFIAKIKKYINENNIDLKKVQQAKKIKFIDSVNRAKSVKYYQRTIELLQKKVSLDRIAKNQDLTTDTIIKHIEKILDNNVKIDLEYLMLPSDKFETIKNAFAKCENDRLKPVFELLKGKYSYDEIKLVRVLMMK